MRYNIPFIRPSLPSADEMAADYNAIVEANWFTNFGPFERQFADKIAAYIGPDYHAVTFSSATAGLLACGLQLFGKGDGSTYVLMPSFTFAAGADIIEWCGHKPLFIDIEPDGLHMDIAKAKAAIKKHRKDIAGILFCNAFGTGTGNIRDWEALAIESDLPLLIDSAAGFGSRYADDSRVGTAGDAEVFSFHATKSFAIGEGGAVTTKDAALAERLMQIQNFGFGSDRSAQQLGFNGKLQEFNAAIGLRRLKQFDAVLKKRQIIAKRYEQELDAKRFGFQKNLDKAAICFATIVVKDGKRDEYLDRLHAAGVEAKAYYHPSLHRQAHFKNVLIHGSLSVTERIDTATLSLPCYESLTEAEASLIIETLAK